MKMEKDIDKIYRRRFEGAKMPPPEDSWENILSQLHRRAIYRHHQHATGLANALVIKVDTDDRIGSHRAGLVAQIVKRHIARSSPPGLPFGGCPPSVKQK